MNNLYKVLAFVFGHRFLFIAAVTILMIALAFGKDPQAFDRAVFFWPGAALGVWLGMQGAS